MWEGKGLFSVYFFLFFTCISLFFFLNFLFFPEFHIAREFTFSIVIPAPRV